MASFQILKLTASISAIPDGHNLRQKLQALAIIKSKYLDTRKKLAVSSAWMSSSIDHRWSLRTPLISTIVKIKKLQVLELTSFGQSTIFSQRAANGTSFDVRWSLV